MIFPLREEGTGETAAPKHLLGDHLMSFVVTSHTLVLMVHAGESQCISVYNFLQGLCSSVPLTGFDLGFAEVLVGLNSTMSVCSCSVSMPYQEARLLCSISGMACQGGMFVAAKLSASLLVFSLGDDINKSQDLHMIVSLT